MPLKIYDTDINPSVRAILMTAELLKLNYERQEYYVLVGEDLTKEYLDSNPFQSVTLLEDGDFLLCDSHVSITYLVSKYGAELRATLYPNELTLRATIDSRMYFDTSILCPAIIGIVKAIYGLEAPDLTPNQVEEVNAAYEIVDKYLQKTKFVAGDYLTVADVSLVASISALATVVPVDDKYAKLKAWFNLLQEEDWYQKGNLSPAQFEKFVNSKLKM